MLKPLKPLYPHDCNNCRFVGHLFGKLDIYCCLDKKTMKESWIFIGKSDSEYVAIPISLDSIIAHHLCDDKYKVIHCISLLPSLVIGELELVSETEVKEYEGGEEFELCQ